MTPDTKSLIERLRERMTLRYIGNCKCGHCQLVPADLVAEAADRLEALTAPVGGMETTVTLASEIIIGGIRLDPGTYHISRVSAPDRDAPF